MQNVSLKFKIIIDSFFSTKTDLYNDCGFFKVKKRPVRPENTFKIYQHCTIVKHGLP